DPFTMQATYNAPVTHFTQWNVADAREIAHGTNFGITLTVGATRNNSVLYHDGNRKLQRPEETRSYTVSSDLNRSGDADHWIADVTGAKSFQYRIERRALGQYY